MKRFLALLLAVVMLCTLCACGKETPKDDTDKGGDTTAPRMERAFSDGDKVITVRFNEKVLGNTFTVSGAEVASVERSADDVTCRITLTELKPKGMGVWAAKRIKVHMEGDAPDVETIYHRYFIQFLSTGG